MEDVCRAKIELLKVKNKEIEVLKKQLIDNQDQLQSLNADLTEKQCTLQRKTQEFYERCGSLQAQLESSQRKNRALEVHYTNMCVLAYRLRFSRNVHLAKTTINLSRSSVAFIRCLALLMFLQLIYTN